MRMPPLLLVPALLALAACGATNTSMPYAPTVAVQPAAPARPLVGTPTQVVNERRTGREDPTWIGTIRGGYGNPLKALHADVPVDCCKVAEDCWDPVGRAIVEYAHRFERLSTLAPRRG